MKKIIFLLLLVNNVVFSQEKSTMDLLTSNTWYMDGDSRIFLVFTDTKIRTKRGEYDYYLSDTPVYAKDFDESKIGTVRNGKYIVKRKSLLEIKELTAEKLFYDPLGSYEGCRMFISNSPSGYLEYYAEMKQEN